MGIFDLRNYVYSLVLWAIIVATFYGLYHAMEALFS